MYGRDIVAPPGNQVATEKTNIDLQHRESPVYSTITHAASTSVLFSKTLCYRKTGRETKNFLDRGKCYKNAAFGMASAPSVSLTA
jgi:hypothetical protein